MATPYNVQRRGGWIPPSLRDRDQMRLTHEFHESIGTFGQVMRGSVREADRVIYGELQKQATGRLFPRWWQSGGCCVGVGAGDCYLNAMVGDVVNRGNIEEIKMVSFLPTYGVGRLIAFGDRCKPGDGSFGGAQSLACQPTGEGFGYLPLDHPGLPQPAERPGEAAGATWLKYPESTERQWSCPSAWPIPRSQLQPQADDFGIETVTRITSIGELTQALQQCFGITVASMYGSRKSVVRGDVAVWEGGASWAHQMSVAGYLRKSSTGQGPYFWICNQWGPMTSLHTPCPTMGPVGVEGGAWVTARTFESILGQRDSEVYAHSATYGFPVQQIDWESGFVYYDRGGFYDDDQTLLAGNQPSDMPGRTMSRAVCVPRVRRARYRFAAGGCGSSLGLVV